MNYIKQYIINLTVSAWITYLIVAFISFTPNPNEWSIRVRFVSVLITLFISFVATVVTVNNEK